MRRVGRGCWAHPPTHPPRGRTRDTPPPRTNTSQHQSSRAVHTNALAIRCAVGGEGSTAAPVERGLHQDLHQVGVPPISPNACILLAVSFHFSFLRIPVYGVSFGSALENLNGESTLGGKQLCSHCTKTALSSVSTPSGSPAGRTVHQWLFLVRTKPAHPGAMSFN